MISNGGVPIILCYHELIATELFMASSISWQIGFSLEIRKSMSRLRLIEMVNNSVKVSLDVQFIFLIFAFQSKSYRCG